MFPQRQGALKRHDRAQCAMNYKRGIKNACIVQCNHDKQCVQNCSHQTIERYPVERRCAEPSTPCIECGVDCSSDAEAWAEYNCAQACPNGWDWNDPKCTSCLGGAEEVYNKCADDNCKGPCSLPMARQRQRVYRTGPTPHIGVRQAYYTPRARQQMSHPVFYRRRVL